MQYVGRFLCVFLNIFHDILAFLSRLSVLLTSRPAFQRKNSLMVSYCPSEYMCFMYIFSTDIQRHGPLINFGFPPPSMKMRQKFVLFVYSFICFFVYLSFLIEYKAKRHKRGYPGHCVYTNSKASSWNDPGSDPRSDGRLRALLPSPLLQRDCGTIPG